MKEKDKIAIIGVDLGGTNIRAAKIVNGHILKTDANLVPQTTENPQVIINKIIETIRSVFDTDVQGIGIGIPSLVDREKGIVYDVQNIPSWKEVPLKDILEKEFNVNVFLDNDANCFAIGERLYGKGKNSEDFVGLTLGTGVGGGIISRGILFKDKNCGSGEFGNLPYKDGMFEDYCSGKFFQNKLVISGDIIYENAMEGNPEALELFEQFGFHLANLIKAIMFTVDPEKIIIGGSVANANEFFAEAMYKQLKTFPYANARKNINIEFSEIKQPAILGAAAVCISNMNEYNLLREPEISML